MGNLPAHVKTHSEFKGLPCKFCSKEFPTIGSLKRHEKIHTDTKEHKCRFCGKGFVQKANMQSHERIHTGERPYKCQYCNEGFVQSTRRRQHEATCKMKRQLIPGHHQSLSEKSSCLEFKDFIYPKERQSETVMCKRKRQRPLHLHS